VRISVKKFIFPAIALFWIGLGILLAFQDDGLESSTVTTGRIVSLAPNLTEILFALGIEDEIAAVSSDSDYPSGAAEKVKVGNFWQPSLEAIISAGPDLVVALWFEQQNSVARRLERMGYRSLTLKIETVPELFDAVHKIGEVTGREKEAQRLVGRIQEQFDDIQSRFHSVKPCRVLWVVQTEPLRVAGRETFVNELIELAGGVNAIGPTLHKYPPIGTEQLFACSPDVIIQPAMLGGDLETRQQAAEVFWSRWKNVPAVKNKRVYVLQADTVSRLGPRLAEGVRLVARCLHPGLFQPDPNEQELNLIQ
jgi:iron complex transport system substrate-binding protein